MQRRVQIITAAVLILAVAGAGLWAYLRSSPARTSSSLQADSGLAAVKLTPLRAGTAGVEPTTSFRLTSEKPLTLDHVRQRLTVEPAVDLQVAQADSAGRAFEVRPSRALDANKVYRFRLSGGDPLPRTYQWSFQTRGEFRILGTLPRDQGTSVPTNTGIEITFSHENYEEIAPYFQISPNVPGRFERRKKTVVFIPDKPLAPGTVYTVTIRKGLGQKGAEGKLEADYTFSFETQPAQAPGKGGGNLHLQETLHEFPTADAPYFQVFYDKAAGGGSTPAEVTVWRYRGPSDFAEALAKVDLTPWWASWSRSQYREPTGGLEQAASFRTELKQLDNYHGLYLLFPEPMAAGYYLGEVRVGDLARQFRFQVTDLASYVSVTSTQTLVWLNDLSTKGPVKGARVTMLGAKQPATATTDESGVATLPTAAAVEGAGESRGGLYLHVVLPGEGGKGAKEAVVVAPPWRHDWAYNNYYSAERQQAALYWKYLYLDRELYKPDDRVNVWGVVHPREQGAVPVQEVTVEVTRSEYRGWWEDRPLPLVRTTLKVEDSTYKGSVSLPDLRPGHYELTVRIGDLPLVSRWFEVQTYTKPSYVVDVTPSKRAVFAGEEVVFDVKAAFFEGTPVANLALSYNLTNPKDGGNLVRTDSAGQARIRYVPDVRADVMYGSYETLWFNLMSAMPEAGEISVQSVVSVFHRDVEGRLEGRVEGGQATVTGKVNHITLDKINSGADNWEYLGGPAAGITVEGTIIKNNWIRENDGNYYDFIQKVVVPRYRYRHEQVAIGTFTAVTGPDGQFTHRFPVEPDQSYTIRVTFTDKHGRKLSRETGVYGRDYRDTLYYGYYDYRWFHLQPEQAGRFTWGLNDEVALVFKESQAALKDRAKGFLFYTARRGLQQYRVQDSATFRFRLGAADPPNTNVRGVYFDGRMYRESWDYTVRFDPAERKLNVKVTLDKESYRPGETVNVTVQVTDRQGRPVQARVNLNLVDEALYALRDQKADLLGGLYGDFVPSGVLSTRRSHNVPMPGSGAEKGGDGGGARKNFQDAVFFESLATDGAGRASASFRVPDNLTTWRLTYQAFAPGTISGETGTTGVVVKLPFFAELVMPETLLAGDQPEITVRSYGTGLTAGQRVSFHVRVEGPQEVPVREWLTSAAAFEPVQVALPALTTEGAYTVRVEAKTMDGRLSDAIEKPMRVVSSYLRQNKVAFQLAVPGIKVNGAEKGVTTLTFTDFERGRYLHLLHRMRWQWGNRFEQKLARTEATALLKRHFGIEEHGFAEPELNAPAYQTNDGSIAILPYSDGDLALSAITADLAPDRFDRAALELYFRKVLDDPGTGRDRAVIALYGMAALGQPVLTDLYALLGEKDLTVTERLYLGLALAELGDWEGARPVYNAILKEAGEQIGSDARIKAGRDQDEIVQHTALALVLSAKLSEPQSASFVGYLLENEPRERLVVLEQVLAASEVLQRISPEPVSIAYVLEGKEERRELKPGESLTLPVTAKALADFRVTDVRGKVGMTASYEAPVAAGDLKQQEGFRVAREYTILGRSGKEFRAGDVVRVSLRYAIPATAPNGAYEVSDYLPSGLRLIEKPWNLGQMKQGEYPAWPIEVNGQKVTFWAWKQGGDEIIYYARVVAPGTYTAEQPTLHHQKSGQIQAVGQREQVKIQWLE